MPAPSNQNIQLLASAARTTTQTLPLQGNRDHRGVQVVVDITNAGTGSITTKIQGQDANGIWYDLLAGAAVVTAVTTVLKVYPGITVAANLSVADVLPAVWRVVVTANNANSVTYSVGANLLV